MKSLIIVWEWSRNAVLILLLFAFVLITGCDDDGGTVAPPIEEESVWELIQSNNNLETLAELLEGTSLAQTLSGPGTVTIFAPNDAAFEQLPEGYLEILTEQQLLDLLRYHVVNGLYPITDEIKKESIISVEGDKLYLEIGQSSGDLLNGRAKFTATNVEAENGQIHIIDAVLRPDQMGTLGENIKKRYEYRSFYNRMEAAGMLAFLDTEGVKTALAAPDLAIDALETQLNMTLTDEQWKEIMTYHLLNQDISGAGPGTRTELVTLTSEAVFLTVDQPNRYVLNGNEVGSEWIQSVNGNVVFVAGVMLPDKYLDVLTLMGKRFNLQVMRNAFAVARLTGTLYNTNGEFTIFVPRDDVSELGNWPATEAELAEILKYHVLTETLMAGDMNDEQTYRTWHGDFIIVQRSGNAITINGTANLILADIKGRNGVIHVLNGTLGTPSNWRIN